MKRKGSERCVRYRTVRWFLPGHATETWDERRDKARDEREWKRVGPMLWVTLPISILIITGTSGAVYGLLTYPNGRSSR
jgi:hypothetical protein